MELLKVDLSDLSRFNLTAIIEFEKNNIETFNSLKYKKDSIKFAEQKHRVKLCVQVIKFCREELGARVHANINKRSHLMPYKYAGDLRARDCKFLKEHYGLQPMQNKMFNVPKEGQYYQKF